MPGIAALQWLPDKNGYYPANGIIFASLWVGLTMFWEISVRILNTLQHSAFILAQD